ncbi:hypothetical protein DPMN_146804 [Dreissena polymorpha]|uniref:Uncharacterized protein n=1 Tax=Dreissena polymorpha TaxID=45954 RepID=A0A9D4J2Q4_DREPO|nr:hypothetical protein DPMN_146804 [Dreissena polymorpha]
MRAIEKLSSLHISRLYRRTNARTHGRTTETIPSHKLFRPSAKKTAPTSGGHVFPPIWTIFELNRYIQIFELVRDINETNVLTKFHDDWAKIVTSIVFTRFLYSHTAPLPSGHVFQRTGTLFELN